MRYDLHAHSTHSDGLLTPAALVERAAARGVDVLALTDHDEVSGIAEAQETARALGVRLVPGAELSVSWEHQTLHIVALGLDPAHPELAAGLAAIREGRLARARRMADALAEAGIGGAWEGARRYVTSDRLIARTHFARFLVETGHAREVGDVFKRFLTRGKPGYVPHVWATLAQAVGWIRAAGGQAVIAHPGRYPLSPTAVRRLLDQFRAAGGEAIEVLSPSHTAAQTDLFAGLARAMGFAGSCGSDFHGPAEARLDLGELPDLPAGLEPVWRHW